MKSIVVLIAYMGPPPSWFPLFLHTCGANPSISWQIYGDQLPRGELPANVSMHALSMEELLARVRAKLHLAFPATHHRQAYKISDLRPAFGVLFEQETAGYDFYGYGDLDVFYGDLRAFLTPDVLSFDVISTHAWCVSGHFCVFRNVDSVKNAFRRVPGWMESMSAVQSVRFDEDSFIKAFTYPKGAGAFRRLLRDLIDPMGRRLRRSTYLVEQYTTPLVPTPWHDGQVTHPEVWYWYKGKIYNDRDGAREFPYLHFMNYVSARYMALSYGRIAPWKKVESYMNVDLHLPKKGFRLDLEGIYELSEEDIDYLESCSTSRAAPASARL